MKVKILMEVPMETEKCKSKAMQIAVSITGVSSVSVGGKTGNELTVIGEDVDAVFLATSLRRKFCFARIMTIEEVKPPSPPPKPKPEPEPKCQATPICYYPWQPPVCVGPPSPEPCSIM
ncbi:heavy metal-associated isoprenylated plant protein 47-like [Andrographis paniculata]|uniref:heavy metal-associated isoprenylated plant protein 47-like n=1 Tax=Andrographis paniculata TaxID=175694 RepID=UPI0021E89770|nr:heavy metal-associated isoprenylated plant protein 47-like [Andrographis paniculata]